MDLVTGPSVRHRNSPQGLNISSIRVSEQIRNPEIPITLRPLPVQLNVCKFTPGILMTDVIIFVHDFIYFSVFLLYMSQTQVHFIE